MSNENGKKPLLKVVNVSKEFSAKSEAFSSEKRVVKAVNNVSFDVYEKETIGIVGESGCGKTTLGKVILHLVEGSTGEVFFEGRDVLKCRGREMRRLRRDMQIVYQDPFTSLNPRERICNIIAEPLLVQNLSDRKTAMSKAVEMLKVVGLPEDFAQRFPHECSGGQRQRVGIARALISNPKLIVCDEAVSALDVSTQSQIINLLKDVQKQFGLTYLFISHNLSVVRYLCNKVVVMYLGQIVEMAESEVLFNNPVHPYTAALFEAIPMPDPELNRGISILDGDSPNPLNIPSGCPFHTRCKYCIEKCKTEKPEYREVVQWHFVACHRAYDFLQSKETKK